MEEAVGPKIRKLEKEEDEASNCWCTYARQGMFEVECLGRKFFVDMKAGTCGYRKWDVIGISCAQAIFAILHQGGEPIEYLSENCGKEKYFKAYNHMIYLMPSVWPRSNQPKIEPPNARAAPGRPKKMRERGVDEPRNSSAIRKGVRRINVGTA